MNQCSFWYKEHKVLISPIEPTMRDYNVYSLSVLVYSPDRTVILEDYINCDQVFWKGFDNKDNIVHYYTRWIDNNGDWSALGLDSMWED